MEVLLSNSWWCFYHLSLMLTNRKYHQFIKKVLKLIMYHFAAKTWMHHIYVRCTCKVPVKVDDDKASRYKRNQYFKCISTFKNARNLEIQRLQSSQIGVEDGNPPFLRWMNRGSLKGFLSFHLHYYFHFYFQDFPTR